MIQYKGGDGSSKQVSIIILGAPNETEGVDAEYDYLEDRYGEYELVSQELIDEADRQYDLLKIKFMEFANRDSASFLIVTHDLKFANSCSDRIFKIENNRIVTNE